MNWLIKASKLFARLSKRSKPSKELVWAVKFLEWKAKPHEVIGLSRAVFIITLVIGFSASLMIAGLSLLLIISLCVSIISSWLITQYPKSKARIEAIKDLGYGPDIITMLVSSLELNPNLERAVQFAGSHGEGRIAKDLLKAYNNSLIKGMPLKQGLMIIANKWGELSPGFKQSLYLIMSSISELGKERRELTLSNGLSNYLQSINNELESFLARVKISTMILFSFGTVIPLVIVSLIPVITVMSSSATPMQVLLLLSLSLILIYAYSNHVLSNKPSGFSQVSVSEKPGYPAKGDLRLSIGGLRLDVNALLYCLALFLVISSVSIIYLGSLVLDYEFLMPKEWSTLPLVVGLGLCLSAYYSGSSGYKVSAVKHAVKLEGEVLDVLYNLGSRVQEGRSVEAAFKHLARISEGKEVNDYLKNSYLQSRELSINVEEALNKSLKSVDSSRVKSIFKLFFNAVKRGVKGSASVIYHVYNYFQNLVQVENESNNKVKQMLSTMNMTAVFLSPLICAMIVVMQQVVQGTIQQSMIGLQSIGLSFFVNPGLSFELLQGVLGVYMLLLLIILVRYSVITQGGNQVMLKQSLSKSIIIALMVYSATLIIASGFA